MKQAVLKGGPADGKKYAISEDDFYVQDMNSDRLHHYRVKYPANQFGIHYAQYAGDITRREYEDKNLSIHSWKQM